MNTTVIGKFDRFVNNFTKKGRIKNKFYNALTDIGMDKVRIRNLDKDKFVMLASKDKGSVLDDIILGIDLKKKEYVRKNTEKSVDLLPFDKILL